MPREFISRYTQDLTSEDLGKLFTRETPEAYRFFARGINTAELDGLPWYQRCIKYAQGFFLAFTMRLSPARRLMYGVAIALSVIGLIQLFAGFGMVRVPIAPFLINIRVPGPTFANGTWALLAGFLLMNLLVLLEVADRLSLKRDLEVAREIQNAMLPNGTWSGPGVEARMTLPAANAIRDTNGAAKTPSDPATTARRPTLRFRKDWSIVPTPSCRFIVDVVSLTTRLRLGMQSFFPQPVKLNVDNRQSIIIS